MVRLIISSVGAGMIALSLIGCAASSRIHSENLVRAWDGQSYAMREEGVASYYAEEFNGRRTSNGETYDMNRITAAHRTLPFNSLVRVTNKQSGKSIIVRINDRGPFKNDRIIDLSLKAAKEIELIGSGTAEVIVEVVELGDSTKSKKH